MGPRYEAALVGVPPRRYGPPSSGELTVSRLRWWNQIALEANGIDHTPVGGGEIRIFGEQLGPTRTSRAFAIIHIAMFDAVNAVARRYRGYTALPAAPGDTSAQAALAQAAHDTLAALYPSQRARFDRLLEEDLARIPGGRAKLNGVDLGKRAAAAVLESRSSDQSSEADPVVGTEYTVSLQPGRWRPDPVSQMPIALGAYWTNVDPFVLPSASSVPIPPPPALASAEYTAAFKEVKQLGGDGVMTPHWRTADQTVAGIYWGYDGVPGLGTPPRLYNQIAVQVAASRHTGLVETARLLALVNIAMADACIAGWKAKYQYDFWRPVTAIREADPGTGPSGLGDGNPETRGDPGFTPLGAQASNLSGPDFTPPFPAYPSGHAIMGSAMFHMLRKFYRTDAIRFSFVSDEFNGVTRDNDGRIRPRVPRCFSSLSAAEEENGQSRIYLGVHWRFDKTQGKSQGRRTAAYVFNNALLPLS